MPGVIPHPQPASFEVKVIPDGDRIMLCPAGEVDLATADVLEREISDLLKRGSDRVVIDLRGVTFIDSTGIRTLIMAHRQAQRAGQAVSIILGGPAIRRPLELTGVLDHLPVEAAASDDAP